MAPLLTVSLTMVSLFWAAQSFVLPRDGTGCTKPQALFSLTRDKRTMGVPLRTNKLEGDDTPEGSDQSENEETGFVQSNVNIDDGGSDLTDRFKYKVQALMGNFDPADASQDTESTSGNIIGAIMNFPTVYTFNVVGKPDANDTVSQNAFVETVQSIVRSGAGLRADATIDTTIVPRGSKYVKVSVSVAVENGTMISEIYDMLGALPESLMQF